MCRKLIYPISFVLVLGLAADMAGGLEIKINFQQEFLTDTTTPVAVPEGYFPDYGREFGDRGNGYSYGWDANMYYATRTRSYSTDQRYNTLIEMQPPGRGDRTWEIAVPSGSYNVFLSCGDPSYDDHISTHDVEGVILVDPDGRDKFDEYTVTVTVTDGRLTIKPGPGAVKCPIMFLHITRVKVFKAYGPDPGDGATHSDTMVTLGWTPGDAAVSHSVYFGDNFDNVNNGTGDTFQGNQTETSFVAGTSGQPYPDGLTPGTTYYWRIDEVNDTHPDKLWRGDVWSFKVPTQTAYDPDPPDGATFVDLDVALSWTVGLGATSHLIYFGIVEDNVEEATTSSPEYMGSDPNTSFYLVRGETYYWRIDEFDGATTHQGDVWSFTTVPDIPEEDPNLLCWWKFDADDDSDTYAIDYSGHDHHGIIHGASLELNGRIGEALSFGGDGDYVFDEDAEEYLNGLNAITVCMWIRSNEVGTDRGFINCTDPNGRDDFVAMRYDATGSFWGGVNIVKVGVYTALAEPNEYYRNHLESSSDVQTKDWQHVAMTWSSGKIIRFYVNGKEDVEANTNDPCETSITVAGCAKLIVGKGGQDMGGNVNGWNGLIDDVRIYSKVLSEDDIKEVMRGEPNLAWHESPANGSTVDLHRALPLSWLPGDLATQHGVYFGTDRDAVVDADTSDTTGIYRPRQAATSYTPEGIELGTGPYYWRIDEYNTDGTITKGRLWQFKVADFILVDDIEDYNDNYPDRVFNTWKDGYGYTIYKDGSPVGVNCGNGTGSAVGHAQDPYAETVIVNSGRQSLPFYYDNSATGYNICNQLITKYYSEAKLALDYPRDWTEQDVKALTIWFRGYAPGFKEEPAGTYTITASGEDIGGEADEFRFVWKKLSGAGSISAKVLSVENTNEIAKAGVMIRRGLDPAYQYAAVYITAARGCKFQARTNYGLEYVNDSDVATTEQEAIEAPYWIKIVRDSSGNFTGYYSSDGQNWQLIQWNPGVILMPSSVYIGLALTSHNVNAVCKAQFSDIKFTGTVTPVTWTNEVIGSAVMRTNAPEPVYVAVANKTGSPVVVYHDDPNASQIDTWTQWNIDLKDFETQGINLADVNSIALGVGNRNSAKAGGSGLMYFDDIRLYRSRCVPDKVTLSQSDLNSDCVVDCGDLQIMASGWLTNGPDSDLNADSTVDFKDYAVLADQWLDEVTWP